MRTIYHHIKMIPRQFIRETLVVIAGLFLLMLLISFITPYSPQKEYDFVEPGHTSTTIFRATVESISNNSISVTLKDGPSKGVIVNVPLDSSVNKVKLNPGSSILVTGSNNGGGLNFYERYRLPVLIFIIGLFIAAIILVGRRKGLMSIAGLGASILVIGWGIVPLILAGYNSFFVTVLGAFVIAIVSILLAHGFQKRTFISLLSVLIILLLVTIGSQVTVAALGLTGIVDEASFFLGIDRPNIDLSGIIAGGIVIAALGALDDIVTTQVATVDELRKVNKSLSIKELFKKASSVGGEHIAALVNTLALVYAGAGLPLIVIYAINTSNPFLLINSEFIAAEIARTVIVSIGLVLSVPVSTFLAALLFTRKKRSKHQRIRSMTKLNHKQ